MLTLANPEVPLPPATQDTGALRASRPEVPNRRRPRDECLMDMKTTATKPAGFPKTDAPQTFREMTEKRTAQAKETYEKMSAATTEAASLIENGYSTAVKGARDYNDKFIEFAWANTNAAFDFLQKLSGVKSPSEFVGLSSEHARKQFELLTKQTKQLAALAQKATLATAEPLKTSVAKAFNHAP